MSKTFSEATRLNANSAGRAGLLINPFFDVSQENGNNIGTTANYHPADQWANHINGTLTFNNYRQQNTFNGEVSYSRFRSSLAYVITGTQTSFSSTQYFSPFTQNIEGLRMNSLGWGTVGAKSIDVLLVIQASKAGTYSLTVRNAAATRSYVTGINLVVGMNIVLLTVPGDTTGTWPSDNTHAMSFWIGTYSGSTYHAPVLSTWQSGNYISHASHTNLASTNGAFLTLLHANIYPSGILPYRDTSDSGILDYILNTKIPYDEELTRCLRYWERISTTCSVNYCWVPYSVRKRTSVAATGTGSFLSDIYNEWGVRLNSNPGVYDTTITANARM